MQPAGSCKIVRATLVPLAGIGRAVENHGVEIQHRRRARRVGRSPFHVICERHHLGVQAGWRIGAFGLPLEGKDFIEPSVDAMSTLRAFSVPLLMLRPPGRVPQAQGPRHLVH